jgi:hypothetical protein
MGTYAGIKALSQKVFPKTAECLTASFPSAVVFAKTGAWDKDLYDSCVSEYYKVE